MTKNEKDVTSGSGGQEEGELEEKLADDLRQADPADIAAFIASTLLEMRKLAVTFRMRFLVYLLEMAYQEADLQAAEQSNQKEP